MVLPRRRELVPCNLDLPRDHEHYHSWTSQLEHAWKQEREQWKALIRNLQQALPLQQSVGLQAKVNCWWTQACSFLENFLSKEARKAEAAGIPMHPHGKPQRNKGDRARTREVQRNLKQAYQHSAVAQLRVWHKLWGRLLEAERNRHHGNEGPENDRLWVKIRRCAVYGQGMTSAQAEAQVHSLTKAQTQERLRLWRSKLRQDTKEMFRWLREKPAPATNNVYDDELDPQGPATTQPTEVLDSVLSFWDRIWPGEMEPEAYLRGPPPTEPQTWAPLKGKPKQKGKAAGPCGWTGTELAVWPQCLWDDIAEVLQAWETRGCFPEAWSEINQVHLAKPGKAREEDSAVPVSKLRPISLLSVWWRVFMSARLRTQEASQWLETHLHHSQTGGRKSRDAQSTCVELAEAYARQFFVASLDLSKAFDRVHPTRAVCALRWFGFPENLVQAVSRIWGNQLRYLSWNGETLARPRKVTASMPQGDSLSPAVMNLLLACLCAAIQRLVPTAVMKVFLDDRSWGTRTAAQCRQVYESWRTHTACLGLRENEDKKQFSHKTVAGREELQTIPEFHGHIDRFLHALGASMGMGKANEKELARVDKAAKVADKLKAALNGAATRAFVAGMAATAKASYAWICRTPAKRVMSKLETKLKRAGYWHPVASTNLGKLVVGHSRDVRFCAGAQALTAVHRSVKTRGNALSD